MPAERALDIGKRREDRFSFAGGRHVPHGIAMVVETRIAHVRAGPSTMMRA